MLVFLLRVLLSCWQNMVGPGEVDDDLQPEVIEECSKYGEVNKCLIFEVSHQCRLQLSHKFN